MNYFHNLAVFFVGFSRLGSLKYKAGWGPWKFLPLYAIDYFANVLTGGAVESISRRAQRHRDGTVWDKLLDAIEAVDPGHGPEAGHALWETDESPVWVQAATILIALAAVGRVIWQTLVWLFS